MKRRTAASSVASTRQSPPPNYLWVIVEALNAVTDGAQRVIDELELEGVFDTWESAWKEYTTLHSADKWREYYMLHTDRIELNIGIMDSFGHAISNLR